MAEWHEFRLCWAIAPNPTDVFAFKKTHLLPMLERCGIEDFLMLDEPKFMLLRVDVDDESAKRIHSSLEEVIRSESLFSRVTVEVWSPIKDAKDRILAAKNQAKILRERGEIVGELPEGGWMIKGKAPDGKWAVAPEDLDKQITAFSAFMARVLGKFTKAYVKEMPYRVEDRWLMSLFIHLILDSVSTWQNEENESREFPYI